MFTCLNVRFQRAGLTYCGDESDLHDAARYGVIFVFKFFKCEGQES